MRLTFNKHSLGSVIQMDFENIDEGERNLGIKIITSDYAIQYFVVTPFEICKLNGERR